VLLVKYSRSFVRLLLAKPPFFAATGSFLLIKQLVGPCTALAGSASDPVPVAPWNHRSFKMSHGRKGPLALAPGSSLLGLEE
jgi:hypothetical protein